MYELSSLSDVLSQWIVVRNDSLKSCFNIIAQFEEIIVEEEINNKAFGSGFNPLRQFDIDERTHSLIIGNFLNPLFAHGQKRLFLNHFLRLLHIISPEDGTWEVCIEAGRIDILLRRQDPHTVIVIENKSNFAIDQTSQLYRYWYEYIYQPNQQDRSIDFLSEQTYSQEGVRRRYRIIYLSPARSKIPSEQALKKPYWLDKAMPEKIPIMVDHIFYGEFIVEWLENCKRDIPATNHRLRDYVDLYIGLWKPKT